MSAWSLNPQEKRAFTILWILSVGALCLGLPYMGSLLVVPLSSLFPMLLINSLILYPVIIYTGIQLQARVDVAGTPFFEGRTQPTLKSIIKWGLVPGIIVWFMIIACDKLFALSHPLNYFLTTKTTPILYGFLASFYGGIVEEIIMRLFAMSLILYLFKKLSFNGTKVAIVITALLFGAAHLPIAAKLLNLPLTALPFLVISRTVLLSGIGGIAFGWLYWKKGLLFAMVSHFVADIGLHVLMPIVYLLVSQLN